MHMNRQGLMGNAALAAMMTFAAATVHGEFWQDFGQGSGSLPGIIHLENFDSEAGSNYQSGDPQFVLAPDFDPILLFTATDLSGSFRIKTAYAAAFEKDGWEFLEGTSGRAFSGYATARGRKPSAMRTSGGLWVVQPAAKVNGFIQNTYAASYSKLGGWTGVDGSLSDGGITNATPGSYSYEAAVAVSTEGTPFAAYSAGSSSSRHIYVQTLNAGVWAGLAGSDETPLTVSAPGTATHLDPAIAYWRGGPVAAWTERNITMDIIRMMWLNPDTGVWEHVGASETAGVGFGRAPQILTGGAENALYLAYENRLANSLKITAWDDDAEQFVDLGNPLDAWQVMNIATHDDSDTMAPAAFALALDSTGTPAVAFRAESPFASGQHHLMVSYLSTAGEWIPLGNPDEPGGVTQAAYTTEPGALGHYAPTLAFDLDNYLMLGWVFDDGTEQTPAVLLKRTTESLNGPRYSKQQGRTLFLFGLLGVINTTDEQKYLLDLNRDDILDAGDAELFAPEPLVP